MRSRTISSVLLVALLLALAGCSGIGGGGAGAQPYQTPLNGSQVEQQHSQALRDAGSFTFHVTANTSLQRNQSYSVALTSRVDAKSGAFLVNTSTQLGRLDVYQFENGTSYTRLSRGNRSQYVRRSTSNYNASQFTSLGIGTVASKVNFTYNGTTTVDGATVHEYVARNNQSLSALAGAPNTTNTGGNVTSVLRIYARSDGLVKRYQYHVEQGSMGSFTVTGTYSNVGSTDVSPPEWLGAAKSNTTSP